MNAWQWIVLVVVVVLLVALAAWAASRSRSRKRTDHLRDRFGPEYDETLRQTGSQREAERELDQREQRRHEIDVRPLDPVRAQQYAGEWQGVQSRFVDDPEGSVRQADDLVTQVMDERGYPTGDRGRQYEDISVDHPDLAADYRAAHGIAGASRRGEATTEQLREAMVHYRSLFGRLLGDQAPAAPGRSGTVGTSGALHDAGPAERVQRDRLDGYRDPAGYRDADVEGGSYRPSEPPTDLRGDAESLGASRMGRHERLTGDGYGRRDEDPETPR